ncbi:MAG: hypothetical protein WC846_01530 [Candidatus Gracilibacteria bacterium]|jgi:hypothetical protein
MKLKDFRKKMKKNIFSVSEARVVCFADNPDVLNLQLHLWKKSGDLISLKRGIYMFADTKSESYEVARKLYSPCYFSLEYALSFYRIMPEAVFAYTLVSTKATRHFKTPLGTFTYQQIKKEAFTGFDMETLMADKEKALVDYFYLHSSELETSDSFWDELRLEAGATKINFKKALKYAKLFKSKKLNLLLNSFWAYAKSHQNY